jgi:AraC family transcriptional regulator of adaptative response / DNA-3-methyladenine glycosylase II
LSDLSGALAQAAAALIDEGYMTDTGVSGLAARIGVTERHLRRLFGAQFGVSILEYAQTQRLLLAKRLLTDTSLPITDVALAAGFGSVRRFNDVLKTRYGLAPGAMRKHAGGTVADALVFELAYRPPLAWTALLQFLAARAVDGVEQVAKDTYTRTLQIDSGERRHIGLVRIAHLPQRFVLQVTLSSSLAHVIPQALGKVRRLCDLGCRPEIVDLHLGDLASDMPGLRLPGAVDGFEIAVRAVVGQVISVAHARTILARLATAQGAPVPASIAPEGLRVCFPTAERLAACTPETLQALGVSRGKAQAIIGIAVQVVSGKLRLEPGTSADSVITQLCEIDGVGDWTAQYVAMRALGWPDAYPTSDYVLRKTLGIANDNAMRVHAAQWAPWRAYAAMHLWRRHQEEKGT